MYNYLIPKLNNMTEYKVTFKNFLNGEVKTVTLGESRTIANEKFREVRKRLSWWWRAGVIHC